jgi:hypothetical protein
MSGENGAHKKHVKNPPEKKSSYLPKISWGEHKPLVDLNDHLKYNVNTNVVTKGLGTMLTCPLCFWKFGQGLSEKLA